MTVLAYLFRPEPEAEVYEQQERVEQYGASLRLQIDSYVTEQGTSLQQPFERRKEGGRILEYLGPGDVILTDRAEYILASARDGLRLLGRLRRRKVSLYSVDLAENLSLAGERKLVVSEGAAELVSRLLEALAILESNRHGETIKIAKQQLKKEGKYLGGPVPFGWKVVDGYLEEDAGQQQVIERIRRMRADRWSYRDISQKLKASGIDLSHEGIRKVLRYNDATRQTSPKKEPDYP